MTHTQPHDPNTDNGHAPRPRARSEARAAADPYAPPPRHKDKSGVLVRGVILAGLLGVAALGYSHYAAQPRTPLVATEEQQLAENMTPPAASFEDTETAPEAAPAQTPAPPATRAAPPAPAEPAPPPSTTIEPPPAEVPPPL